MADSVVFKAHELLGKHGFQGGDMLDDLLEENGFDPFAPSVLETGDHDPRPSFSAAVLSECVRRHLVPQLGDLVVDYEASACHNPVRLSRDHEGDRRVAAFVADKAVMVTVPDVLKIANVLAPLYRDAVPAPTAPGPR